MAMAPEIDVKEEKKEEADYQHAMHNLLNVDLADWQYDRKKIDIVVKEKKK